MSKFPHTQQESSWDCGIACITTMLNTYGKTVNFNFVKDMSHSMFDLTMKELLTILTNFDAKPKALKMDPYRLHELEGSQIFPFIALINDNHYIVIHQIKNKKIIISDPRNDSLKSEKIERFEKKFSGKIITINMDKNNELTENQLRKKQIKAVVKDNKYKMLLLLAMSFIIILLGIISSFFMKIIVDEIIPHHLESALNTFAIIFLSILILKNLLEYIRNKTTILISKKIDFSFVDTFFKKLFKLPLSFFEKRDKGEFITRFDDISYIRNMVSGILITAIIDIFLLIISGTVLYIQNPTLFFVSLLPILLYVSNAYFFFNTLRNKNLKFMEDHTEVTSLLIQSVQNIESIYSLSKEKKVKEMLEKKVLSFLNNGKSLENTVNTSSTINNIINSTFSILLTWVGVTKILNGSLSLGTLLTFTALLSYFVGAVDRLVTIQPQLQKSFVAMERYYNIIHYDNLINNHCSHYNNDNTLFTEKIKKLEIKKLSYGYSDENKLFSKINLSLSENQCIALMGESGVGKSTLSKLLNKSYDCDNEMIFYNDIDINNINNKTLKNKVVYLSQHSFFWKGSIRDNISMGFDFSDEEIYLACEKAGLLDTIKSFEKKLGTLVLENGDNFSTGQKQRIAIARIFLLSPDVIIIDEVMSNIDENNERKILINLKAMNSIKIIITHKKYDTHFFDDIYQLTNNEIYKIQ